MALYPYKCEDCGTEDYVWWSMESYKEKVCNEGFPTCKICGSSDTIRVYTAPSDPYGESAFKSYNTEQLNQFGGMEHIATRREEKERLDSLGLMKKESGMDWRAKVNRLNKEKRERVKQKNEEIKRMLHDRGLKQGTRETENA